MKKIISLFILIIFITSQVFAFELDVSVDEEIRKNYNPGKIEQDVLPPLPKTQMPTTAPARNMKTVGDNALPPKTLPITQSATKKTPRKVQTLPGTAKKSQFAREGIAAIKIKKGTKFKVRSLTSVSDSSPVSSQITFKTTHNVTQRYVTIPEGTILKGRVEDAHTPQITGNGGLIVIGINSLVFRGATRQIEAKVTKANGKKIFANNIKGQRKYWKGVANSTKPGAKFYKKSMRGTAKLAQNPWTLILTPFTAVAGVVVYGANIVGSPLFAVFSKGGRISIPAGTEFEIKLLQDVYLD